MSAARSTLTTLTLGALGVVYGDIGTSPLYAIKESFHPGHGVPLSPENVLGILSLMFWSLMVIIVVKYLVFMLRANNEGEGGIMALVALLSRRHQLDIKPALGNVFLIFLGLAGAGLLFGEGIIMPAISVLSAVEGLQVATPAFQPMVVPLTIGILLALFAFQRKGTERIARVFGPVMLVWFITLAATGLPWIIMHPSVLQAISPVHAVRFFSEHGIQGAMVLGSVVLCISGAEALYADLGHFGPWPIRTGWLAVVFPALLLNYFGQGALILEKGAEAVGNPFYGLVGGYLKYPLIIIATLAAVVASQALITGMFSLTQQAAQLGYLPRLTILHTSRERRGQVYIPKMNLILMLACLGLVAAFQESGKLAGAYGFAVTGVMLISTLLFYSVMISVWKWKKLAAIPLLVLFLAVELPYFGANVSKILHGGWIPLVIAIGVFALMSTWKRGRAEIACQMHSEARSLDDFVAEIAKAHPHRVKGTAVFMTLTQNIAPNVLLHHYRHNHSLHERVILLSILTESRPQIAGTERVRVTELDQGFVKISARYGYMETPDISEILLAAHGAGLRTDYGQISYYLGRETLVTSGVTGMPLWRKKLFGFLSRNARSATEFFNLPPDRVIEIGSQISI